MGSSGHTETGHESFSDHLRKLDHWTFLLALAIVLVNVIVVSPYLSAIAALLLLVALGYDAWEFSQKNKRNAREKL